MNEIEENLNSLLAQGRTDEAEALLFSAAESLTSGAGALLDSGDYHGAVDVISHAIELMRRHYTANMDFAELKISLSDIYMLLSSTPPAIRELSEAVSIMEHELGPDHQSVKDAQTKLLRMKAELDK